MNPLHRARCVSPGTAWRLLPILMPVFLTASPRVYAGAVDAQERAAKKACLSGDYAKGVSILSDLYIDTKDPTYIFNQGRCFEQSGRYEDAIIRFREYLTKKQDAGAGTDASAERHIADCEKILAKQRAQAGQLAEPVQAMPPTPAAHGTPVVPPAGASPATPMPPAADLQVGQASQPRGTGLRVGGIVAAGVGVASVVTGAVLALKANSLAAEIEASPTSYSRNKESTRASYATFSTVGYGAGVACIVGGAILYYLGWKQGQPTSLALLPALGPASAGAVVQGAF